MDEKKTTPEKEAALKALRDEFKGTDADTQARRTLAALRLFPLTTYELSRGLDVYHPPARIKELRQAGNNIITMRETVTTEAGVKHSLGKYVLLREASQEQAA
ncbi:helix-turn-helix domain-containing protein [Pelomonas sp. V22]|uniref:helix-turn-helix domain-containing protein n=1 Tax=Pelomonas sp. V22 TaxID=2822139 RepID=UPI0024A9C541|nr:helix-turn-helix domain-containing protein [Pelomonas sp. V22]MDI4632424.1 helix-turn-helix domain-containing protein [Pelomonas sp. V22]